MLGTRVAAIALCLGLTSCLWPEGDGRVFVTSEPAGAEVLVDGETTGKTTPAELYLGDFTGGHHEILVRKKGFEEERRRVTHYTRFGVAQWYDGIVDYSAPAFPLFWTIGDFLFPFEMRWAYVPHNLHVRLFPEGTFRPKPARAQGGRQDTEATGK